MESRKEVKSQKSKEYIMNNQNIVELNIICKSSKYMDVMNSFIGYGNPNGEYWFMGIEEGGEWKKDDEKTKKILKFYKSKFNAEPFHFSSADLKELYNEFPEIKNGQEKSPYLNLIKTVRNKLLCKEKEPIINNSEIGLKVDPIFILNYHPISHSSSGDEYPEHYFDLFGVNSRECYNKCFLKERKNILRAFIKEYIENSAKKTIYCFGNSY